MTSASPLSAAALSGYAELLAVVAALRHPETGCPWDLKQTHQTLRPYLLEESYEAVDAIDSGDLEHIREELGDVLLQVVLHAQIAQDNGAFTADDVARGIAEKLIRRHPHVFQADHAVSTEAEVVTNWQALKAAEKAAKGHAPATSVMDGLPKGVPSLSLALEVSRRAVKQGFDWPDFESLWACVLSEHDEFRVEHDKGDAADADRLEDELGDILFSTVNLARFHGINPEIALNRATQKFLRRYRAMETLSDKPIPEQSFETLDDLWNQAKRTT